MALSGLQKFILRTVYAVGRAPLHRKEFLKFYQTPKKPREEIQGILTRSLERLIDREYLIGYGRRTPHKWFIETVKLTAKGRQKAKQLLGQQQSLPFHRRKPRG